MLAALARTGFCRGHSLPALTVFVALAVLSASRVNCADTTTSSCRNVTTEIKVNETQSVWCAGIDLTCSIGLFSDSCYCDEIREVTKVHTTTVCEDDDDSESDKEKSASQLRTLTDPEVAAIAVICSLVFSILISLSVFLIQRRRSLCRSCKTRRPPEVVEIPGDKDAELTEMDRFLPPTDENRFVHVRPANVECNVYEEIGGSGGDAAYKARSAGAKASVGSAPKMASTLVKSQHALGSGDPAVAVRNSSDGSTQTGSASPPSNRATQCTGSDNSNSNLYEIPQPARLAAGPPSAEPRHSGGSDLSGSRDSLQPPYSEALYENDDGIPTSTL